MKSPATSDDFYVGYRSDNPPAQGRFTRRSALLIAALAVSLGALFSTLQHAFDPGLFEFGEVRTVQGTLRLEPQPIIQLDEPVDLPAEASRDDGPSTARELLLVGVGKRGATDLEALDGLAVSARGSLIAREGIAMLELADRPQALDDAPQPRPDVPGRTARLTGEIIDSKCFLGVMKPGHGKVHRACATLCLEGGVPPAFLVRGGDQEWVALLLDADGQAPQQSLAPWVGEALTLQGSVHARTGGVTEFHVDLEKQLP